MEFSIKNDRENPPNSPGMDECRKEME